MVVEGYGGCDLGLLEHKLGDENGVGVFCISPGEVSFVLVVPLEEFFSVLLYCFLGKPVCGVVFCGCWHGKILALWICFT